MANDYESITIQGKSFKVRPKYAEGHVLKANEAATLNQTLFENLRNNMATTIKEGQEAGLSDDVLQQQLDDYASTYEFGERRGGGFRGDPVMTTAMNLARELVRNAIKAKGLDTDDFPATKVTQLAKAYLDSQGDNGKIITLARQQVEAEKAAAAEAMSQVGEMLGAA